MQVPSRSVPADLPARRGSCVQSWGSRLSRREGGCATGDEGRQAFGEPWAVHEFLLPLTLKRELGFERVALGGGEQRTKFLDAVRRQRCESNGDCLRSTGQLIVLDAVPNEP